MFSVLYSVLCFVFPVFFCAFYYIIDRVNQNSLSIYFRRANTDSGRANMDSGGPIRLQEGQYGFSRANTEPSMDFSKANTKPFMHFRRANTYYDIIL